MNIRAVQQTLINSSNTKKNKEQQAKFWLILLKVSNYTKMNHSRMQRNCYWSLDRWNCSIWQPYLRDLHEQKSFQIIFLLIFGFLNSKGFDQPISNKQKKETTIHVANLLQILIIVTSGTFRKWQLLGLILIKG